MQKKLNILQLFCLLFTIAFTGQLQAQHPSFGQYFEIVHAKTKQKLCTNGNKQSGALMYTKASVQTGGHWMLEKHSEGMLGSNKIIWVRIKNRDSGMYLANFMKKNEGAVIGQTSTPGEGALWRLMGNQNFVIINKASKLLLGVDADRISSLTSVFQIKQNRTYAIWSFQKVNSESTLSEAESKPKDGPTSLFNTTNTTPIANKPTSPGFIGFIHEAGYIADFEISYNLDGKRKNEVFNNKTLGYKKKFVLPPGATNITVSSIAHVFIDTKKNVFRNSSAQMNKWYKIYGTTLRPEYKIQLTDESVFGKIQKFFGRDIANGFSKAGDIITRAIKANFEAKIKSLGESNLNQYYGVAQDFVDAAVEASNGQKTLINSIYNMAVNRNTNAAKSNMINLFSSPAFSKIKNFVSGNSYFNSISIGFGAAASKGLGIEGSLGFSYELKNNVVSGCASAGGVITTVASSASLTAEFGIWHNEDEEEDEEGKVYLSFQVDTGKAGITFVFCIKEDLKIYLLGIVVSVTALQKFKIPPPSSLKIGATMGLGYTWSY